jgi:hypothetical protein
MHTYRYTSHRGYTHLEKKPHSMLLAFLFLSLPSCLFVFFFFETFIQYTAARGNRLLFEFIGEPQAISELVIRFFGKKITLPSFIYPVTSPLLLPFFVTHLSALIVVYYGKMHHLLKIWLSLLLAICLYTALFFIVFRLQFNLSILYYSEFFMRTESWNLFVTPILLSFALIALPIKNNIKSVFVFFITLFLFFLNATKYFATVFLLSYISSLYIPVFIFLFGPLLDYFIIVALFGYFTRYGCSNHPSEELPV